MRQRGGAGRVEGSKQAINVKAKPGGGRGAPEPAHQMVVSAPASQLRTDTRGKDVKNNPIIIFKPAELAQIDQYGLLPGRHQALIHLREALERSQERPITAHQLSSPRKDFWAAAQFQRFEDDTPRRPRYTVPRQQFFEQRHVFPCSRMLHTFLALLR